MSEDRYLGKVLTNKARREEIPLTIVSEYINAQVDNYLCNLFVQIRTRILYVYLIVIAREQNSGNLCSCLLL